MRGGAADPDRDSLGLRLEACIITIIVVTHQYTSSSSSSSDYRDTSSPSSDSNKIVCASDSKHGDSPSSSVMIHYTYTGYTIIIIVRMIQCQKIAMDSSYTYVIFYRF